MAPLESTNETVPVAVSQSQAAAFLGVSVRTIQSLRENGLAPFFKVPTSNPAKSHWRIDLADLVQFKHQYRKEAKRIDPQTAEEFPVAMVAKMLGLSEQALRMAKIRGSISDYTPKSVLKYALHIHNKAYRKKLRTDVFKKYQDRNKNLRFELQRARERLRRSECPKCGNAVARLQPRGDK